MEASREMMTMMGGCEIRVESRAVTGWVTAREGICAPRIPGNTRDVTSGEGQR